MTFYRDLSPEERRATIEGRLLSLMTIRYGGQRFVAGPKMTKLLHELVDEMYKMREDELL